MSYQRIAPTFASGLNLPKVQNFLKYFDEHPDVGGLWRFDKPSLLNIVGGKVTSIASYLPSKPPLVQATAAKQATVVFDAELGRNVARFSRAAATNYAQSGGAPIFGADQWSIVIIHKPAIWAFSTVAGVGSSGYAGINLVGADRRLQAGITGATAAATVDDGWVRQIAAHPGGGSVRQKIGVGATITASGGTSPTGSGFTVGNNTGAIAYDGDIDLILAVNGTDILADPADPLTVAITTFLDRRGV